MPIYEYRCSTCGFQEEYLRKVSDPLLSVCPECEKETFGKMLTAAGFQLKGGGWYATDFKNSGAKPVAKSAGEGGTASQPGDKSASAGEGKGEGKSKSEGKSEGKTAAVPAAAAAKPASASAAKAE